MNHICVTCLQVGKGKTTQGKTQNLFSLVRWMLEAEENLLEEGQAKAFFSHFLLFSSFFSSYETLFPGKINLLTSTHLRLDPAVLNRRELHALQLCVKGNLCPRLVQPHREREKLGYKDVEQPGAAL